MFERTELLLGTEAMERLAGKRVAVFGIGGVGGYVCEALVRSGIGAFDLVDSDTVCLSNLNRQIIALHSTLGRYKTQVMKERMMDIHPNVTVRTYECFFLPENADTFPFQEYDYVVDAIDTVTAKIELILRAQQYHIPIISAMGAGNKVDPGKFRVADIYDTRVCPLARVMRRELKKRGVEKLKVVYSEEPPVIQRDGETAARDTTTCVRLDEETAGMDAVPGGKKRPVGSIAFGPSVCGLLMAGEIVRDLADMV